MQKIKKSKKAISYRDRSEIAASDISNFIISESLFLKVKSKEYERPTTQRMKDGTIAHCKILTPELFWDEYYIAEALHPKQKEFVDNILSFRIKYGEIFPKNIEDIYTSVYTKPKPGDGMILFTKLESHIRAMYENKSPITGVMNLQAEKRKQVLEENIEAVKLLEKAKSREEEVYFEYEGVKCKAKIDANGISPEEKEVTILDIKILGDPTSREMMAKKISEYGYDRQVVYYGKAVTLSPELQELYEDLKNFKVSHYIVMVDPVSAEIFKISEETEKEKEQEIKDNLSKIKDLLKKGKKKPEITLV